jgi:predicted nucleotidyltransferase
MIAREQILELSCRIAARFHPERIILFGSHGGGEPGPESDVDLLVVLSFTGSALRTSAAILDEVQPRIPVDLIVRTPEDFARRVREHDFFLAEVAAKAQILYEAAHG